MAALEAEAHAREQEAVRALRAADCARAERDSAIQGAEAAAAEGAAAAQQVELVGVNGNPPGAPAQCRMARCDRCRAQSSERWSRL